DGAASNAPILVPVTLTLVPPPPAIGVSRSSLSFTAIAGIGVDPLPQRLGITNTGGGTLAWTAAGNASWLSLLPTSGTAPSTTLVLVRTLGLAVGTYHGAITVSGTGATNSPVTVPVTLTVIPPPAIGVSPSSLSFVATAGRANPPAQPLAIT